MSRTAAVCACALAWASLLADPGAGAVLQFNPIQLENALAGSPAGALPDTAANGAIEGYASEVSALPGDSLHFHVSTRPAAPYRVEIYRLGFYAGAGARLIGCTPSCSGFRDGQPQAGAPPRADGPVQAGWPVTDVFVLPADATSGYYRARFVLSSGETASTWVIVRAPPGSESAILVQVPVNTWEAYNTWGGSSLYGVAGSPAANRVSFDRPYAWNPLGWEYPLVLFLGQQGYDVSYQTDLDTDRDPSSLLGHRLVVAIGHGEYWTGTMRSAFETARDNGVNLAFMGSNEVYWRARYEDGGRSLVVYKSGKDPIADPSQTTGLFRVVDRPECELVGIQHQGGKLNWPPGNYAVVPESLGHPWFAGTGFVASSELTGLVSIETDTIPSWDDGAFCGHDLTVFFHHEGGGDELGNADAIAYTAPSGAVVFAAGSERFSWGLIDPPANSGTAHGLVDPRLQRFARNMLDDLSAARTAALDVELSPITTRPTLGKAILIRAVVTNEGPDPAGAASLDLALPTGLTFVRIASRGLVCSRIPLRCDVSGLTAGSSITAVITLKDTGAGVKKVTAYASTPVADNPGRERATCRLTLQIRQAPRNRTTRYQHSNQSP